VIRPAREADNAQIAAIWNLEAIGTTATTDTEPRSPRAQQAWLAAHGDAYPALVAAVGDEILGFGALAPYRPKPSYARTVEDSVYVKAGWRGKGIGGLILDALVEHARERDHHSVIARIIADNEASRRLHERHGFVRVGHEREAAFKLGRWLAVLTLQRML
jgi:phosphinothricin acetyltransferase